MTRPFRQSNRAGVHSYYLPFAILATISLSTRPRRASFHNVQASNVESQVSERSAIITHSSFLKSEVFNFAGCKELRIQACDRGDKNREYNPSESLTGKPPPCMCNIPVWNWIGALACSFGIFAAVCLVIIIWYLQSVPSVDDESECGPAQKMEYKLKEVKRQGFLRRLKVSGPPLICGFVMLGFGIPVTCLYIAHAQVYWVSFPLTLTGFTVVAAALLPTDTRTIRTISLIIIILCWFLGVVMFQRARAQNTSEWYDKRGLKSYQYFRTLLAICHAIVEPTLGCYLLYHLCVSPMRRVLHLWWTVVGIYSANWALNQTLLLPWVLAEPKVRSTWSSTLWATALFNLAMSYINAFACLDPRLRHYIRDALSSSSEEAAAAAGVANMISHTDPIELLNLARSTFTCVSADRLTQEDMADNVPNPRLRAFAEPEQLGSVDAFMSHSWHDDPEAKWNSLQAWRQAYKEKNDGQEPKLWIDKYCIDQNNISESLACLPVYLSGCKKLVVFFGNTYLERLWCVLEIFVFLEMNIDIDAFEVHMLGDKAALASITENFEINQAQCFAAETTDMLMGVIDAGGPGMRRRLTEFVKDKFNKA